jgi:serine acetyltransferase
MIGSGVTIIPKRKIANDATLGAGSVVITNVKAGTTVFGNPAKKIK